MSLCRPSNSIKNLQRTHKTCIKQQYRTCQTHAVNALYLWVSQPDIPVALCCISAIAKEAEAVNSSGGGNFKYKYHCTDRQQRSYLVKENDYDEDDYIIKLDDTHYEVDDVNNVIGRR